MNRKTSDLIAGILCSGFSIVGISIMNKSELVTWVTIVFFGIGAIVLLLKYFNPKSKFFPKQKDYNNKFSNEEFTKLYNSNGIFTYQKNGFELKIEEKLTKIEWNQIEKLIAYKVDLFTSDEIRLFLKAENGKQFEISESTQGWFQFNEKIKEQFPEINKTWEVDISVPAFERKETIIFDKNNFQEIYPELRDYIFKYCGEFYTELENKAKNHYVIIQKFRKPENVPLELKNWITTDKEALNLLKKGYNHFFIKTTNRIYRDHKRELELNLCPKCRKIARTPKAQQCRFCSHSWH